MNLRILATPLVATTLLLNTLGCSKKEDPAATSATGSYQLDNTTLTCQAKASSSTGSSGGITIDYLTVDLTTTPQPTTGAETLRLYFAKPNVQSNTTYTLTDITLTNKGITVPYSFSVASAALATTSNGGFSGTFSGTIINPNGANPAPYTAITNGKFTNVRP
jgi:hypothetical protein